MEPELNDGITDELLIRFLYGEADEAVQARVTQWLALREGHKQYQEQLRFLQQHSRIKPAATPVNIDEEWQAFQTRIAEEEHAAPAKARTFRVAAVAAALAIVLSFAGVLIYNHTEQSLVTVKAGNRVLKDTLPDGSVVTLNKGAELQYKQDFSRNRHITLLGEGFFEVMPDKSKPFVITAAAVRIRVVGTSFNVRSTPGRTEVVVETGTVEVSNKDKHISLLPHEKGIAVPDSGLLISEAHAGQLYNYYRSKLFVCKGTTLGELVAVLNSAYDKDVRVPDPATRALKITATYEQTSFDEILNVLCSTLGLQAEQNGRRITLK